MSELKLEPEMQNNSSDIHIGRDQFEKVDIQERLQYKEEKKDGIIESINQWLIAHSPIKTKELVVFYRLLATMINSGVTLVKSLAILEEQSENERLKMIARSLRGTIERGQNLSTGMGSFPDVFEEAYIGMIHSGETTGKLNDTLVQIADQVEANAKLAGKIKGAMMYPIGVIVVMIGVFFATTILVIPKMKEVFDAAGAALPASTRFLIAVSDFLTGKAIAGIPNMFFVFGVMIIGYVLFITWKKTPDGKYYWENFIFKMPVFGILIRKSILGRFCRSLSTLLTSGVSITKAIQITGDVVGSEVYRRRIEFIAADVSQGIPIAENISGEGKTFPVMMVSMIGVGEQTAQLDHITARLAEFYEEEVNTMVKNLTSLMEPIIILLLGGVVGFLVSAIMGPIMKLSDVAVGASS